MVAEELTALKRAVRGSRNASYDERRQSAAGQIAGLITTEPTVAELMAEIVSDARRIIGALPAVAEG